MKLFAAQGAVEIQAQSDNLELSADQLIKIISAKDKVQISAPKEILLTAGGSYIKINAAGVESGTAGQFIAYAGSHSFVGPKTLAPQVLTFMKASHKAQPICEACERLKRAANPQDTASDTSELGEALNNVAEIAGAATTVPGEMASLAGSVAEIVGGVASAGLSTLSDVLGDPMSGDLPSRTINSTSNLPKGSIIWL